MAINGIGPYRIFFPFQVTEHKTAKTHGPLEMAISQRLYAHLNIYVSAVRSKLHSNLNYIFLNKSGGKMTHATSGGAITVELVSAGMCGRVSFSLLRKSIVTLVIPFILIKNCCKSSVFSILTVITGILDIFWGLVYIYSPHMYTTRSPLMCIMTTVVKQ